MSLRRAMVCAACAEEVKSEKQKLSAARGKWALEKGQLSEELKKKSAREEELKDTIEVVNQALAAAAEEVAAVRAREDEAAARVADLESEIDELRHEAVIADAKLLALGTDEDDATDDLRSAGDVRRVLEALEKEHADFKELTVRRHLSDREAHEAETAKLEADAAKLEAEIAKLEAENAELRQDALVADISALSPRSDDAAGDEAGESTTGRVADLEQQLDALQAEHAALVSDHADFKALAVRRQASDRESNEAELAELRREADVEMAELRREIAELRREAEVQQGRLAQQDNELREFPQAVAELRLQVDNLQAERVILEMQLVEIDVLRKDLATAHEDIEEANRTHEKTAAELQHWQTQADDMGKKLLEEEQRATQDRTAADELIRELTAKVGPADAEMSTAPSTPPGELPPSGGDVSARREMVSSEAQTDPVSARDTVSCEAQTDAIAASLAQPSGAAGGMDSTVEAGPKPAVQEPAAPKPAPPKGKGKGAPPPPKAKFAPPPRAAQNAPSPMKAKASRTLQLQWEKPRKGVSIFEDAVLERMSRGAVDPLSPGSVWDTDSNSPPPKGLLAWFTKPETVVREEPSSDKGRRKGSAVMDERECLKVGVIMQRLKKFKSTGEMKEALVTCDESRLTADDLDVLAVNFPAKAACEKVRKLAGESMGPYDQFVSMLDSIPKLRERLECMMFVQRFDSVASDVEARVQNLRKALDFLCSSAELQTILQTFRRVGNALNEGTRVGNFDGFALNNAATTLANCVSPIDKRVTLRSYAVSLIPEVVARFTEEATVALARVKSGGAESTMELIRDVVLSFENIRTREVATRRRTVCPAEFDPMDTFSERMETFAKEHEERVHSLATAAMRWGQDYVQALVFFGDAGNFWPSMKSEGDKCAPDFFHCMLSLAAELKKDLQAIGPVSVEPKTPIRPNRTPRDAPGSDRAGGREAGAATGGAPVLPPGATPALPPGATSVLPPGATPVLPPGATPVWPPGAARAPAPPSPPAPPLPAPEEAALQEAARPETALQEAVLKEAAHQEAAPHVFGAVPVPERATQQLPPPVVPRKKNWRSFAEEMPKENKDPLVAKNDEKDPSGSSPGRERKLSLPSSEDGFDYAVLEERVEGRKSIGRVLDHYRRLSLLDDEAPDFLASL